MPAGIVSGSLFRRIKSWFTGAKVAGRAAGDEARPGSHFVYLKIPEPLMPLDRGSKYEDPIAAALEARQLGSISGGGAQLGDEQPDGTRPIEICGIDIDVTDLEEARRLLRGILVELGASTGTEIHFSIGDEKLQDELRETGWILQQPRTFLHPGFGI
jgi:hypothetical protein